MNLTLVDPILYIGVDIGIKRDTSAVSAVYRHYKSGLFCGWGIRIFTPPVNILQQVEPLLLWLFEKQRIGGCAYDETQFTATVNRLTAEGYGSKLIPVNQNAALKEATSTLHQHCNDRQFAPIDDDDLRSHMAWCAVKISEQGLHISKKNQSRPIDGVVATAMALAAATGETGFIMHPAYEDEVHAKSAMVLP